MKIKKFLIIAGLATLMLIIGISSGILIEYKTNLFKKDQESDCENKECNCENKECNCENKECNCENKECNCENKECNNKTSTYKISLTKGTISISSNWHVTKSYSEVNDLRNELFVRKIRDDGGITIEDPYTGKTFTLHGLWPIHKKTITEISKENSHITVQYESSFLPGPYGFAACGGEIKDFSNYVIVKKSDSDNEIGIARIKKDGIWEYIPYTYSPKGKEECGIGEPYYEDIRVYYVGEKNVITYQGEDSNLSEIDNMITEYLLQVYKNQ